MKITIDTTKKELILEDTVSVKEVIEFCKEHKCEDYNLIRKDRELVISYPSIPSPSYPHTPWDNQPYYFSSPYMYTTNEVKFVKDA